MSTNFKINPVHRALIQGIQDSTIGSHEAIFKLFPGRHFESNVRIALKVVIQERLDFANTNPDWVTIQNEWRQCLTNLGGEK